MLVDQAMRMQQLDESKKRALQSLLTSISAQQAEKDFQMAEFWRRTGHPGSAYFYYEIVRRRYPDPNPNSAASRATQRMLEIRAKMEQEQRDKLGPPPEVEPARPIEQLAPPRRLDNTPEPVPMPRPVPNAPEMAPPPRPLPPGVGGQ